MCRSYGIVASEETGLECSLVESQNALFAQCDRDLRGVRNPNGWGIAAWDRGVPGVVKSGSSAFASGYSSRTPVACPTSIKWPSGSRT